MRPALSTRLLLLGLVVSLPLFSFGCTTPSSTPASLLAGETVRILLVGDPFSLAVRALAPALGERAGGNVQIEVVSYDDLRELTLRNAQDQYSSYDIVSFDVLWVGEYGDQAILLPLDSLIAATPELATDDFLPIAYAGSAYAGQQLGLPIQPHPELLWVHTGRLAEAGLTPPRTTTELIAVAAALTDPINGQYGICWDGQRGEPLGQQMAHFYAAFGQPLLTPEGRPSLNTPQGLAAARFTLDLLPFSPPDVLSMAWNLRPRRFIQGGCAMTYEWAARAYLAEEHPTTHGQVQYLPAPHAPDAAAVTPLGTWSLGIPANIGPRRELAWRFLAMLSSAATQAELAEHGNGGMPRLSLLHDANLATHYPAFTTVAQLSKAEQLADWMRPAIPAWPGLEQILGTVFHDMLRGDLTPEAAVELAQQQAERLLEDQPIALPDYTPSATPSRP
ncbi:MAG: ABC transporter substrate-binding protein [Oscillochloridaceae bacterium umkhey_bin13]